MAVQICLVDVIQLWFIAFWIFRALEEPYAVGYLAFLDRIWRSCSYLKTHGMNTWSGVEVGLHAACEEAKVSRSSPSHACSRINVFFDEDTLEKGDQLSLALSQAIATSNLSIIVLSVNYASSKSCLAELSDIMDRKDTKGHIVLPIFYHVDPSDVRNLAGRFKTFFDDHESEKLDQVQQWQAAFVEVGKLKGWHIEGGKFHRSEAEYIKDIVEYVIKKLMNNNSRSAPEEWVGIDDQKKKILELIEQEDCRVIGLWGTGGIGKTTLADAVYNEVSLKFEDRCFLQNISDKIEKQGMESLRNEFLSQLLNQEISICTPSISTPFIQERLNNKRVIVVLDDVNDSDQIDSFGVKHFGHGSKIILTSRDRQVLNNVGVDKIHEVKKLNENDSLQLFSTFAFKLLNPATNFRDLSTKFVDYAQGNPLALKVLGSKLYKKTREDWESEVDKLREYAQPKISQILKSSFDGLDEQEKNIFLDIAIFFNGESKKNVEKILSSCYKGAMCGISNLVNKCLLDITPFPFSLHDVLEIRSRFLKKNAEKSASFSLRGATNYGILDKAPQCISLHDMFEEMSKDIIRLESKSPGMRSRIWNPKDGYQVLKYNKGTDSIEGIKLDMTQIDNLQLHPTIFENMINLKYVHFYFPPFTGKYQSKKLHANGDDIVFLPDELRYLCWDFYPFKSLSSSFNPKNLVVLKLSHGNIEQLWNEDNHQDLVNLRQIVVTFCKKLRKIPNLLRAINLEILCFSGCENLVEFPSFNRLASLKTLQLHGCYNLKKFPELPNDVSFLNLSEIGIEEVPDSIKHLTGLETLLLSNSRVKTVSSEISKLKSLRCLDLSHCPIAEFPEFIEIETVMSLLEFSRTKSADFEEIGSGLEYYGESKAVKVTPMSDTLSDDSLTPMSEESESAEFEELIGSGPIFEFEIESDLIHSSNLMFKSLRYLKMNHCKILDSLLELPPYLRYLDAHGCTSLEDVSFTYQNHRQYELHSFDGEEDFYMIFSNCFSLDQYSIDNIETNSMLKIRTLAKTWTTDWKNYYGPKYLFCSFPGNEVSANNFKDQSMNSSLVLKITPKRCSGKRFLVFALSLVADLTHCHEYGELHCICEYQLTVVGGGGGYEKFKSEWKYQKNYLQVDSEYMGNHLLILFSVDMIKEDKGYEKASFEFFIKNRDPGGKEENIKVEKCGVGVSYLKENQAMSSQVLKPSSKVRSPVVHWSPLKKHWNSLSTALAEPYAVGYLAFLDSFILVHNPQQNEDMKLEVILNGSPLIVLILKMDS
ncbi:hypothetical protein CXB51_025378 [Gossypium anomalum]|uniref:TIR domain-containing protein n=1 Tax=Gossypium anomalum TaxID=47600 RepID=A0A8J6CU59_9ROSI|nr:hypothetical protein CXB51_025378 [Gossypium anomalum]